MGDYRNKHRISFRRSDRGDRFFIGSGKGERMNTDICKTCSNPEPSVCDHCEAIYTICAVEEDDD